MQYMPSVQQAPSPQPTFSEIKSAAKSSLKQRWPEAIAVSMVFLATALLDVVTQYLLMTIFRVDAVWSPFTPTEVPLYSMVASNCITVFSAFFSLTLMFPLIFGVVRWFWLVTGGSDPDVGQIFYYFSSGNRFLKSLRVSVGLFLRLVLGTVVCFLPYATVTVLTQPDIYNYFGINMPVAMSAMHTLTTTFEVLGFLCILLWISTYAFFYTVMFTEPQLPARKIIKTAARISKGQKMRFVGFVLSFFGWLLLCLFMLPLLFVLPYFLASIAIYGREAYRFAYRNGKINR